MKLSKILLFFLGSFLLTGVAVGATFDFAKPIALFETTLVNRITTTDTSLTLTSATTKDGSTLASSTYGFVIDEGTANEEFILADCTATACTNLTRGVSTISGTTSVTALKKEHRRGASVKITDAPILLQLYSIVTGLQGILSNLSYSTDLQHATTSLALVHAKWVHDNFVDQTGNETVSGVKTLSSKTVLSGGATISVEPTIATDVTSKNYVDNVALQGAATSSNTQAGISRLSVAAVDVQDPIVIGDNDPRIIGGQYGVNYYPPIEIIASTTKNGNSASTTINIDSSKSIFEVFFFTASSSAPNLTMNFNNSNSAIYTSSNIWDNGGGMIENVSGGTYAMLGDCNSDGNFLGGRWSHILIDNSNSIKTYQATTICRVGTGGIHQSLISGYWATSTPISSLQISNSSGSTYPTATSTITVYQK